MSLDATVVRRFRIAVVRVKLPFMSYVVMAPGRSGSSVMNAPENALALTFLSSPNVPLPLPTSDTKSLYFRINAPLLASTKTWKISVPSVT